MIPNALYIVRMNEFLAHWAECNAVLPPAAPLLVRLPESNTLVSRAQFDGIRIGLLTQLGVVQSRLGGLQLARGTILNNKAGLLDKFNQFTTRLDAKFRSTNVYNLRPYPPGLNNGLSVWNSALEDMLVCWSEVNAGPPPAGVTLPLLLPDGTDRGSFASGVSVLQFSYAEEKSKLGKVTLERGNRNDIQAKAYDIMKEYRETVPDAMRAFPVLVETLPRLTPLPGHTPDAVNSSAIFEAPDLSKVVYDASTDAALHSYQLRGNVGDDYSDEDAVVIATNEPGASREFVVPFGLNQPGAKVALKVYVLLTTGNEAGSAAMFVQRPLAQAA